MWTFWKRKSAHDPLGDQESLTSAHLAIYGAADRMALVPESVAAFTASACRRTRHTSPHRSPFTSCLLPTNASWVQGS
jgi:hypothetical protein